MKEIYQKIFEMAKPYYEKGRPIDLPHIELELDYSSIFCQKEKVDESLLIPLIILHDIGYGIGQHAYLEKELKKEHMVVGAKLAKEILEKINYPQEKTEKISYWISVHDNWIFGDFQVYKEDLAFSAFNDIEFLWITTPRGFKLLAKTLFDGDKIKMFNHIKKDQKKNKNPFFTKTAEKLYIENMKVLEKNYI